MKLTLPFIILLSWYNVSFSQFQFKGKVNDNFKNAIAYLSIVDNCNKKDLFITDDILQEVKINTNNEFIFNGDFLADKNRIYKIHIDNCHDNIGDYKHLLNHCDDSKEILFIANNSDNINFPLNDLKQEFCSIEHTNNSSNTAILKIDEFNDNSLNELEFTKSDLQRKNIFKSHFKKLQHFSKQFNEPLAELYTYFLYANENSISREYYLNDLKKSNYYNKLLDQLEEKYNNTSYTNQFKNNLIKDQYPLIKSSNNTYKIIAFSLGFLLLISLVYNFKHLKTKKPKEVLDYKKVLTPQEQKVFELMLTNSNKEIAEKLFVSLSTVKTHINNIYSKLKISSRKDINLYFKN